MHLYRVLSARVCVQVAYMHPNSSLYNRQPEWVVYHEITLTTREYMREITVRSRHAALISCLQTSAVLQRTPGLPPVCQRQSV